MDISETLKIGDSLLTPLTAAAVGAACQEARPDASDTSTFPDPGDPHVILTCPLTSSFTHGEVVPIPTLPFCKRVIASVYVIVFPIVPVGAVLNLNHPDCPPLSDPHAENPPPRPVPAITSL